MKPSLLFFLFSISFLVSCAQTKGTATLYGFKEAVVSGVSPNIIGENGEVEQQVKNRSMNFLVYLQSASRVYPSEMWIMGEPYGVSFQTVVSPVERQHFTTPGEGKFVLVPKTSEKLLHLTPIPAEESKRSDKGKTLSEKNELVVIYKQGGAFYYSTLEKLKELTPVALQ